MGCVYQPCICCLSSSCTLASEHESPHSFSRFVFFFFFGLCLLLTPSCYSFFNKSSTKALQVTATTLKTCCRDLVPVISRSYLSSCRAKPTNCGKCHLPANGSVTQQLLFLSHAFPSRTTTWVTLCYFLATECAVYLNDKMFSCQRQQASPTTLKHRSAVRTVPFSSDRLSDLWHCSTLSVLFCFMLWLHVRLYQTKAYRLLNLESVTIETVPIKNFLISRSDILRQCPLQQYQIIHNYNIVIV